MPTVIQDTQGIFLGTFASFDTSSNLDLIEGQWGPAGSAEPNIGETASLAITAFEGNVGSPAADTTALDDGENGHGVAVDGGTKQNITYITQYTDITFDTDQGSFIATMAIVQLEDGSSFLIQNPTSPSFRSYEDQIGTATVQTWTIPNLSASPRANFVVPEVEWIPEGSIPCFTVGTLILTDRGDAPIEALRQGDLIQTLDNGLRPIRWIGQKKISAMRLRSQENIRPIRIKTGVLGEGLPRSDLIVSPQHRILVRSIIAQKMFGKKEVLLAAKCLLELDGIDAVEDLTEITYVHFLLDRHEIVFANGAETESLYTGPEALKSLSGRSRDEIFSIFPELSDIDHRALATRTFVRVRKGRQLAMRHKNNRKPLTAKRPVLES